MYHQIQKSLQIAGRINKKKQKSSISTALSGKRGIRTPGPVKINGFQDRRIRPLCHLSGCKGTTFFQICKIFTKKLNFILIFSIFVG